MDKFRFIGYRGLVLFAVLVIVIMSQSIASYVHRREEMGRKRGLDVKKTDVSSGVSNLDVLTGLTLKKGATHNGIRSVKLYLANFGYLLEEKHGWNDMFDEQLEKGLRLYQQNFNLSVTGFLDQGTLDTMRIPRCGREDIPDELLKFLSKASSKRSSWNQELYKFPMLRKLKWKSTHNLTYAFSSTIANAESSNLSNEDIRKALASAFESWAAVIPLNFSEINEFDKANIKIEFLARDHGDGAPFDQPVGTVAHAFPPEDGRFHFNVDKLWTTSSNVEHPYAFDVQSAAVHEIGHAIGLDHSKVGDSVMYPSLPSGKIRRALAADDLRAARALYGSRLSNHHDDHQGKEETDDDPSHIHVPLIGFILLSVCLIFICRHLASRI